MEDFLGSLRVKHPRAYAEFRARIERLGDEGQLRSPEHIRLIRGGGDPPIWEVKAHTGKGWRLYGVCDGETWYFTHGRGKPADNLVNDEAKKARRIYSDRSR